MWYQLVLITNLGVITPLATFDNRNDCMREQVMIPRTAQSSPSCLPTNSPEQLQKQFEAQSKMLIDTVNKLSQGIK